MQLVARCVASRAGNSMHPMQLHDCFAYGMAGVLGVNLMSTKAFNKRKGALLPRLRARGDPPPRRMRAGDMERNAWHANLRQLLQSTGGTVVRGFKLYKLRVDPESWNCMVWLATAHVVIATVLPSGTTVYTDPNAQVDGTDEYIFVPSSRAHSELTDEQLLSGDWHLGSVVGGDAFFEMRFVAHEKLQGRAQSVVDSNPDALKAKPRMIVRLPPHFAEWFRVNERDGAVENLAELMGAPVFPSSDSNQAQTETADEIELYANATRSGEACVDGLRGIKLELHCRGQLLRGEMSIAEARRCFFSYFDTTYEKVNQVQSKRFREWCEHFQPFRSKTL